jgi:hypothetical protein
MIELVTEDYCSDCRRFEPESRKNDFFVDNTCFNRTVVRCKHSDLCRMLYNHLKAQTEVKTAGSNICVCCGKNIPEGRQVCQDCERGVVIIEED